MMTRKERDRVLNMVAHVRTRIGGSQQFLRGLNDNQAHDILDTLSDVRKSLSDVYKLANQTPQDRVAQYIADEYGEDNDAFKIAKFWPWNTTNNDWWSHRHIERLAKGETNT